MAENITNEHGLSRIIPSDVRRTVRQNCGFGCVICGLFLYEYDHISPPWIDAIAHDPKCICLLCPGHHKRKTNGTLSLGDVKAAYANPKAKQQGYSQDAEFARIERPIKIRLGNWIFDNPTELVRIGGKTLLALEDTDDATTALSGEFYDRYSDLILKIDKNEWQPRSGNWDVEHVGKKLTIREDTFKLSLTVIAESKNLLVFDNIKMRYGDVYLESRLNKDIKIYFKDQPAFRHAPVPGGSGIETSGFLNVLANGGLSIGGGVKIGAGVVKTGNPDGLPPMPKPAKRAVKIGRNDPCTCGSGKKYKHCHGKHQ